MFERVRFGAFAQQDPDRLAIVDPGERLWSRREIASLANRVSRGLLRCGAIDADVLAIVAPNSAEFMAMYLAGTQIGLYVVPVDWHLSADEIAYVLNDCQARFVFAHREVAQMLTSALAKVALSPRLLVSQGDIPGFVRLDEFISDLSDEPIASATEGRALSYTSATTGRPKGVRLPLENAAAALDEAIKLRQSGGTTLENNVHLCASMLYHGAPLQGSSVALHMGHTLVLVERPDPAHLLTLIDKYRVTLAYMTPATFTRLLKLKDEVRSAYSGKSLRRVLHTGAPCPIEVKRRMIEWWGPILTEVYAGAEGGGTLVDSMEWLRFPGTVGKATPGSTLKILDEAGNELRAGAVGKVYMTRYRGGRFEYTGDPIKTRAAYSGDFFTLGDIGYLNEEGYLFLCGREADMVISNGMNIYPAEIERVLSQHPDVLDCAAFGVADEWAGEVVMAVIQLDHGVNGSRSLTARILKFLSENLSVSKLPRYTAYTTDPLRGATGKLPRKLLRDRYAPSRGRDSGRPR